MERLARPLLVVLGALIPLAGAWAQPGTAQARSLQVEVERLRGYQARQRLGVRLLDGISRSLPEHLWLDRLNVSREQIAIDGRAFNTNAIANFVETLDKLRDFDEPMLRSATLEPDETYRFTISLKPGRGRATEKASLKTERDSLLRRLASRGQMPEVLQRLSSLLAQPGIKVEKFAHPPLSWLGGSGRVLPMEIRIGAESYQALTLLFDRLGRFLPIVALDRMNAARDDANASFLTIDLWLDIPVLKKRAGSPGEAQESEPASLEQAASADNPREPFQILTLDEAARSRQLRPPGVPGLRIADLELRGIFLTSKGYIAQVRAREQDRFYLLQNGDQLFDGEVVRIEKDEAVLRRTRGDAGDLGEVILSLKTP